VTKAKIRARRTEARVRRGSGWYASITRASIIGRAQSFSSHVNDSLAHSMLCFYDHDHDDAAARWHDARRHHDAVA
jgi:hypothetical protein